MQDLEFDENYSYSKMRKTIEKIPLFSFLKFELFTDIVCNTPIIKKEKLLIIPSTLSITHLKIEDDNDFFLLLFQIITLYFSKD